MWRGIRRSSDAKVLDLIEAGRPVVWAAAELGVSDQRICNWRNQDQTGRSARPSFISVESAELSAACDVG